MSYFSNLLKNYIDNHFKESEILSLNQISIDNIIKNKRFIDLDQDNIEEENLIHHKDSNYNTINFQKHSLSDDFSKESFKNQHTSNIENLNDNSIRSPNIVKININKYEYIINSSSTEFKSKWVSISKEIKREKDLKVQVSSISAQINQESKTTSDLHHKYEIIKREFIKYQK